MERIINFLRKKKFNKSIRGFFYAKNWKGYSAFELFPK